MMKFRREHIASFLALFEERCQAIRDFEGCQYLQLLEDREKTGVFFTISDWDSEEALDRYRQSELFRATWKRTKVLFAGEPSAWTTSPQITLR